MRARQVVSFVVLGAMLAMPAMAVSPSTEVWVPAASRLVTDTGFWSTDLTIVNPGSSVASVDLYWLARGEANADAVPQRFTIQPGASLILEDVILTTFGQEEAEGAFRVTSNEPVAVSATITNLTAGGLFGQGFEGVPGSVAISASSSEFALNDSRTTVIAGLEQSDRYRSNLFAVGVHPGGTTFDLEVLNETGWGHLAACGARAGSVGAVVLAPRCTDLVV